MSAEDEDWDGISAGYYSTERETEPWQERGRDPEDAEYDSAWAEFRPAPRRLPASRSAPCCPYCDTPSEMLTGATTYWFHCASCGQGMQHARLNRDNIEEHLQPILAAVGQEEEELLRDHFGSFHERMWDAQRVGYVLHTGDLLRWAREVRARASPLQK